nr:hypothetical protein [uncultured Pantoea sp.]
MREEKKTATCGYCGISIALSRNSKFCSANCRIKATRIIDDDDIVTLHNHSWWLSFQAMLKANPLGLGSITGLNDICEMMGLYFMKSHCQHPYNMINGEFVTDEHGERIKRYIHGFPLELSHRYPNSKGGSNTAKNILIAPALINRIVKDNVPFYEEGNPYNGVKAHGGTYKISKTLLKALVEKFGRTAVKKALWYVKTIPFADITRPKRLMLNVTSQPLSGLLLSELSRLNLGELRAAVKAISESPRICTDFRDAEFLAASCFHALLTGDKDGFLDELMQLDVACRDANGAADIESQIYSFTRTHSRYMKKYFHVNMGSERDRRNLYNRFFTHPPLY